MRKALSGPRFTIGNVIGAERYFERRYHRSRHDKILREDPLIGLWNEWSRTSVAGIFRAGNGSIGEPVALHESGIGVSKEAMRPPGVSEGIKKEEK
jgi:hypothetical protein